MNAEVSLTDRLRHFLGGDRDVAEIVLREVLPKLRQIAIRQVNGERQGSPLSASELIQEVWLRNLRQGSWQIRDREHFYSIAAYAMRQILIDFARKRSAGRRGGADRTLLLTDLPEDADPSTKDHEDVVFLDIAMQRLEQKDRLTARVVDLHYFAGFSVEETAEVTGLAPRQVRYRWSKGQAFLRNSLPR
jgi:RNA polymerase sigma factor (TIGR02999 family)